MTDELKSGSLLVHTSYELPGLLQVQGPEVVPEWRVLSGIDANTAEQELERLGWHFFYVVAADPLARGMALDRNEAVRRAVVNLAERARSERLNALEISDVRVRGYGLIHVARVAANFRHIGASPYLFDAVGHTTRWTHTSPTSASAAVSAAKAA